MTSKKYRFLQKQNKETIDAETSVLLADIDTVISFLRLRCLVQKYSGFAEINIFNFLKNDKEVNRIAEELWHIKTEYETTVNPLYNKIHEAGLLRNKKEKALAATVV